jgi:hypothetical protein
MAFYKFVAQKTHNYGLLRETLTAETETLGPKTETMTILSETRPARDVDTSRDRLETERSRPKSHPYKLQP